MSKPIKVDNLGNIVELAPNPSQGKSPFVERAGHVKEIDMWFCKRCDCVHNAVPVYKFDKPAAEWTHYAICPTTNQPILIRFPAPQPTEVHA